MLELGKRWSFCDRLDLCQPSAHLPEAPLNLLEVALCAGEQLLSGKTRGSRIRQRTVSRSFGPSTAESSMFARPVAAISKLGNGQNDDEAEKAAQVATARDMMLAAHSVLGRGWRGTTRGACQHPSALATVRQPGCEFEALSSSLCPRVVGSRTPLRRSRRVDPSLCDLIGYPIGRLPRLVWADCKSTAACSSIMGGGGTAAFLWSASGIRSPTLPLSVGIRTMPRP